MRSRLLPSCSQMRGNAWNHPTTASLCSRCAHPGSNNGLEARNFLCTPPIVGEVSNGMGTPGRTCTPDLIFAASKEEQSLTQSGDTRPRWNVVLTEARKHSQFGWTLPSSMSARSTTSSKPTQKLSVVVSAYRMQRVLVLHGEAAPTEHHSREWWPDVPSPPVWSNCAACLFWTKVVRLLAAGRTFTKEAQKQLRVRFADKETAIVVVP